MDFQMYIRQLYDQMYLQHQELSELRSLVTQLSAEVKQLKEKPSVTVERLEYKFDQLKVETLEGTLNIGLNPTDLNAIEDLAVPPKPHSKIYKWKTHHLEKDFQNGFFIMLIMNLKK